VTFSIQTVIADDGSEVTGSAISIYEIDLPVWQTEALAQLPLSFTENMGQAPEEIAFVIQSAGYLFGFTYDGFYFIPSVDPSDEFIDSVPVTKMTIEGADPETVGGTGLLPGVAHYFTGSDESDWITDVPTYEGIAYDNVLPGIDLFYSGTEGILKREFLLEAGIAPEAIVLVYEGVESLELAEDGTLLVHSASGIMSESAPVSYQVIDGIQIDLESSFVLLPQQKVSFYVDGYDPDYPLIIDPDIHYSTLLGGNDHDGAMDMAVDSSGNVYLTGFTQSTNFPFLRPAGSTPPLTFRTPTTAFVTKISHTTGGRATIVFSTYLGGSRTDIGRGIALDGVGNIYVTGETDSADFPVLRPIQNGGTCRGGTDVFVTKFLPDGSGLHYSTYIGGTGEDVANSIFVHNNEAYITGKTQGNNGIMPTSCCYPTTAGAYQTKSLGGLLSDAFVSRINDSGSTAKLVYSTLLSGSAVDVGKDIAVDGSGNIYVVGTTSSPNLIPSDVPGYQKKMGGVNDAFVMKLSPHGKGAKDLLYATYLGGSKNEEGEAIALDSANFVYVTGTTTSTDFPTSSKAYQREKVFKAGLDPDIFVSKLNTGNSNLVYSTYLGGSRDDGVFDIYVDSKNQAYVAGYTYSQDYPLQDPFPKTIVSGKDAIVTGLDKDGKSLILSVVFGGHLEDCAHAVHVSATGEVYVAGHTNSKTFYDKGYTAAGLPADATYWNEAFPVLLSIDTTAGYHGYEHAGGSDAFVMKFSPTVPVDSSIDFKKGESRVFPIPNLIGFEPLIDASSSIRFVTWFFGDGTSSGPHSYPFETITRTYSAPGAYSVQLCGYNADSALVGCVVKENYVIVEDSNEKCITVSKHSPELTSVTLLESTSFKMEWTCGVPQPDRIVWEFVPNGVQPPYIVKTSTSTVLEVKEGLPPGRYSVEVTPYYLSDGEELPGSLTYRWPYLDVISAPQIQFSTTGASGTYKPGHLILEPAAPGEEGTEVWMRVNDPWDCTGCAIYWDYGDVTQLGSGPLPGSNPTSHRYPKEGVYLPVVTVKHPTLGTVSSQDIKANKIYVFVPLEPDFTWSPNEPTAGESVTFTYTGKGTPISYEWRFKPSLSGIGEGTSTLPNPSHAFKNAVLYIVDLLVYDLAGGYTAIYKTITIQAASPDLVQLTWDPTSLRLVDSLPKELDLVLDSPKLGLNTFEMTATITNTSVAAFTGKGTPADWVDKSKFTITPIGNQPYKSVKIYGIASSNVHESPNPLPLATLEIKGQLDGKADIIYSNTRLQYGTEGKEYRVRLEPAQITRETPKVYQTLPYPEVKGPQADLNGDGLIDDFDGNGKINAADIQLFFKAYIDGHLSETPLLYDYNKNGKLDLQDIMVFSQLWSKLEAFEMISGDE